jgi:imidazole glycerol phosphate synthase subunit HisF
MTLKARVIPCLDVKDGRPATPAAACPRGRAKKRTDAMEIAH